MRLFESSRSWSQLGIKIDLSTHSFNLHKNKISSIACQSNRARFQFSFHNRITFNSICLLLHGEEKKRPRLTSKSAAKWLWARKNFRFKRILFLFIISIVAILSAQKNGFSFFLLAFFSCKMLNEYWKPLLRYATSSTPPTVNPKASSLHHNFPSDVKCKSSCSLPGLARIAGERRDDKRVSHAD